MSHNVINALMSALCVETQYITSFISALFGKTFNQSKCIKISNINISDEKEKISYRQD